MKKIESMLTGIPVPPVYRVKQSFYHNPLSDIEGACAQQIKQQKQLDQLPSGARIAVAVGSRGVTDISRITKAVVSSLKEKGFNPFVISAMASHGGATPEGQTALLAELNITEAAVGCPIHADVSVVEIDRLDNGLPVYMDQQGAEADGIVVINRIKTHTAFHGIYESGLVKMIAIGLGNDLGAKSCHQLGFGEMEANIVAMAELKLEKCPFLFGVAVIEDGCENVSEIEIIPAEEIFSREPELLKRSKNNMPSLGVNDIDVLVVDRMGKEISGDGMDPNITGRYQTPFASGGPTINKLAILSVTEKSRGNVVGIGQADICTKRLHQAVDFETTYVNSLVATVTSVARLPMVLPSDYDAIRAAVMTCNIIDFNTVRLIRIRDTLHLGELLVSEALVPDYRERSNATIVDGPFDMSFTDGTISDNFS